MKELVSKISAYNIFNNFLPGILFLALAKEISSLDLETNNELANIFLFYFVGMIISRIGSLIIEPLLLRIKFISFSDYRKYVDATKRDTKLEIFVQVGNMYRTLLTMLILLPLTRLHCLFLLLSNSIQLFIEFFILLLIMSLFLFSYRKQVNFIKSRVDNVNE